jgi:hypothetical protein
MSPPQSIEIPGPAPRPRAAPAAALAHPRCTRCGDVIGVYEPMVVVRGEREGRETSRAAEAELPLAGAEHFHRECYAAMARA